MKKYLNVKDFILNIKELPILPENIQKINDLINDENTSIEKITKIVEQDQTLTLRLLKIANSAFYGRISKVYTINEALVLVGLANLKSLLLSVFLEQLYNKNFDDKNILYDLWVHSVFTALISTKLIEYYKPEEKEIAYTSGLLHDIGELFLYKYEFEIYKSILEDIKLEDLINRITIEELNIGFSHCDLGSVISEYWNLPKYIKDAIFCHHYNEDFDYNNVLIPVIQLADILAIKFEIGGTDIYKESSNFNLLLNKKLIDYLGLTSEKIDLFSNIVLDIKNNLSSYINAFI